MWIADFEDKERLCKKGKAKSAERMKSKMEYVDENPIDGELRKLLEDN